MTDGSEPIGNGVGPALEMQDIIRVLGNVNPPKDLKEKSILLSGNLLELTGKTKKGNGIKLAKEILDSGKAFKKFNQIIKAQKGDLKLLEKIKPKYTHDIIAKNKIKIKHIDNKLINQLARMAGSPENKAAGIYFHKKKNQIEKKNESILTIHSTSKEKLEQAKKFFIKHKKDIVLS